MKREKVIQLLLFFSDFRYTSRLSRIAFYKKLKTKMLKSLLSKKLLQYKKLYIK